MSDGVIEGVKVIQHNMGGINRPDDPSYPFLLQMVCRVPGFMEVTAAMIYGQEAVKVRGKTKEALEELIKRNNWSTHPRLISLTVTEPEKDPDKILFSYTAEQRRLDSKTLPKVEEPAPEDDPNIITPKKRPDHPVVGKYFGGHSYKHDKTQIYYCDSHDLRAGYWMTNVSDSEDRKNVSERAIGRTFHRAEKRGTTNWWVTQWCVNVYAPAVT
jgi:hypothetical protein